MKVFDRAYVSYSRMITMDYRLIEQCGAGDSAAVEDFVQTYQRDVYPSRSQFAHIYSTGSAIPWHHPPGQVCDRGIIYCLALSILDDSHEAEDATQESLGRPYLLQYLMAASTRMSDSLHD